VNFLSAYSYPASDRVNLGDHMFQHVITITCHEEMNGEVIVRRFIISKSYQAVTIMTKRYVSRPGLKSRIRNAGVPVHRLDLRTATIRR